MDLTLSRRGLMLVLSSPSGTCRTAIARTLLEQDPHITMSVSCTTRPPRPGEVDGKDSQDGDEMNHWLEYDYILLDTETERSIARVQAILDAERLKRDRQVGMAAFVNRLRGQ